MTAVGSRNICSASALLAALLTLAACTSSTDGVQDLASLDMGESATAAELRTEADAKTPVFREGLFGAFLGREAQPDATSSPATSTTARGGESLPSERSAEEPAVTTALAGEAEVSDPSASGETTPQGRGILGFLRSAPPGSATPGAASPTLLGRARSSEPDVTPGAPLAFGTVGRVCGLTRRDRGKEVSRFPETRMRSAYTLFDTAPGSTSPRAFYITGFADGCARQVTAANVVFGAPSMHERLRYGLPAGTLPSSRTDEAYKQLKSRICRVPRSAPCGAAITRLERNTVFVTMYRSFSGNRNWSNLLLHDGAVLATDHKGRS